MGATCVDVTIRNPADPARSWTGPFLVDTGAFDSLVPKAHLEAIGLAPRGVREYSLANGERVTLVVTVAELEFEGEGGGEFEGEIVAGTVVYGDDDSGPALLGVTALDSGGFEVGPRSQALKRLPAVLLRGMRTTVGRNGW